MNVQGDTIRPHIFQPLTQLTPAHCEDSKTLCAAGLKEALRVYRSRARTHTHVYSPYRTDYTRMCTHLWPVHGAPVLVRVGLGAPTAGASAVAIPFAFGGALLPGGLALFVLARGSAVSGEFCTVPTAATPAVPAAPDAGGVVTPSTALPVAAVMLMPLASDGGVSCSTSGPAKPPLPMLPSARRSAASIAAHAQRQWTPIMYLGERAGASSCAFVRSPLNVRRG